MAKRKRRPGRGSKLRPIKDYRDDQYVPYIARAETGILQAWSIDPDLRDGDVREALRHLMRPMKQSGQLPQALTPEALDAPSKKAVETESLLEFLILENLQAAFREFGPLNAEDTIGILTVINNSVGAWNRGMRGQEYLKYIEDFLGGIGVEVRQLTDEEVKLLGLDQAPDLIKGESDEIK